MRRQRLPCAPLPLPPPPLPATPASPPAATHRSDPELERRRMVQLYEAYLQTRQALDTCYL